MVCRDTAPGEDEMSRGTVHRTRRRSPGGLVAEAHSAARPLAGRVALVTGGATGIGRGCAVGLAEAGARVAVNYRKSALDAAETLRRIEAVGGTARLFEADVTRAADVGRLVTRVERELGSIAILINNVGEYIEKP